MREIWRGVLPRVGGRIGRWAKERPRGSVRDRERGARSRSVRVAFVSGGLALVSCGIALSGSLGGQGSALALTNRAVVYPPPPPPAVKPANTAAPGLSGTPMVGQTLTGSTGSWSGSSPISYGYQWQLCTPTCSNIAGATGTTLPLQAGDRSADVRLIVTATNSAGSAQAASGVVGPVLASSAELEGQLLAILVPRGGAATIKALLKHGGYTFIFDALESGHLTIVWYFVPKGAHLTAVKKPVVVARAGHSFGSAGSARMKVGLTSAGRKLLKHHARLVITAQGAFTGTAPSSAKATKSFKLKR